MCTVGTAAVHALLQSELSQLLILVLLVGDTLGVWRLTSTQHRTSVLVLERAIQR